MSLQGFLFPAQVCSVVHVMPNAAMVADPAALPRGIVLTTATYWVLIGTFIVLADGAGFGRCPDARGVLLDCLPSNGTSALVKVAVVLQLLASLPITLFPAIEMLELRLFGGSGGFDIDKARSETTRPSLSVNPSSLTEPLVERELSADAPSRPSFVSTVSASTLSNAGAAGGLPSSPSSPSSLGPPPPPRARASPPPFARRALLRAASYAAVVLVAGLLPKTTQIFTNLLGCTLLSALGYGLPVVLFETTAAGQHGVNAPLRSLWHILLAALGVVLAIVGTGTSIVALRGGQA